MAKQESLALRLKKLLKEFQKDCEKHEYRSLVGMISQFKPTPLGENTYNFGSEFSPISFRCECVLCGNEAELLPRGHCPGCLAPMKCISEGSSTEEFFGDQNTGHPLHTCKVYECTKCPVKGVVLFIDQ